MSYRRESSATSTEAKVVVLGSQGVGKTSLVLRHVGNTFTRNVSPTIGASFFTFSMTVGGNRVKLQLWDTAGQERFRSMAPMYYRRANAALIVYDITSAQSFQDAQDWVKELEGKVDEKIALCIVGNKCDLSDLREVTRQRGEEFAAELGAKFVETSAAENIGVKEAFLKIAQGVITLFQKNRHNPPVGSRLDVDMSLEGSTDAEMSSHATRPTITKNIKRNAYFYTTRSNADYETSRTLSAGDHYYRERDRTISHVDGGTSKNGEPQKCCSS